MNKEEALPLINNLLLTADAAYLTTIDSEGFPQTRAMLNLKNKNTYPELTGFFNRIDNFTIYFTTNTSSQKVEHIKNNPRISVYYCKPDEWRGVMLNGEISLVNDQKIKEAVWQENWNMYYPKGVTDPDYAVLKLKPRLIKLYHQLNFFKLEL